MLRAYFGHHKCASTWATDIFRTVAHELGMRHALVNHPRQFDGDLGRYVRDRRLDFLMYTNADWEFVRQLPEVRAFHMVRDPRDVVVSAYHSHLRSHPLNEDWPGLVEIRRELEGRDAIDGLSFQIEESAWVLNHLASWPFGGRDDILEVTMEEVTAAPEEQVARIVEHLGLLDRSSAGGPVHRLRSGIGRAATRVLRRRTRLAPPRIPERRLLEIVEENSFARKSGRRPGQVDEGSHYRSGTPGGWRTELEDSHLRRFRDAYGDLPERLGYPSD